MFVVEQILGHDRKIETRPGPPPDARISQRRMRATFIIPNAPTSATDVSTSSRCGRENSDRSVPW